MAITASVQPDWIGPDRICQIWLPATVSVRFFFFFFLLFVCLFVFSKKAWIILRKTDPDLMWMAWPGFGQTHQVWKQGDVQESSGPVSGRTQSARYQLPTFTRGSVLPQTSRIILCKSNGPRLANTSEPIRSGSDLACLLGGVGGRTLGVGGGGSGGMLEESELVKSGLASLNIALPKIMCPCSAALLV